MITDKDMEDMTGFSYYNREDLPSTYRGMVQEFSKTSGQEPDPVLYAHLINEEFNEWLDENEHEAELKELADLVYVIFGYANAMHWNLDEAVRRVHANNMGRMYQPDGTIHRREDGKIIKNKDYPKVNLSDLV